MTDYGINNHIIEELEEEEIVLPETMLYEHHSFIVDKGQGLLRIDKFLVDRLPNVSRNRVQQAIEAGTVFVNDVPVKANYKVKPLDQISMRFDRPPYENVILPEDLPLNIIYEDPYLMVVNKPAGMVVHPGHGNYTGTLLNALAYYFKDDPDFNANDPRLGLVHRIDKDTSGLLLIAKDAEVRTHVARQFFQKTTRRSYQAVVWGRMQSDNGTVRTNIVRDPKDRMIFTTSPYESEGGKTAVTHWTLEEKLGFLSRIACRLETGRTHQIRVHMKSLGHPIFNDARYGGNQILRGNNNGSYRKFVENSFELCPRQALHAQSLGFYHPIYKKEMDFDSPLPDDMYSLLEKWRKYTTAGVPLNLD